VVGGHSTKNRVTFFLTGGPTATTKSTIASFNPQSDADCLAFLFPPSRHKGATDRTIRSPVCRSSEIADTAPLIADNQS